MTLLPLPSMALLLLLLVAVVAGSDDRAELAKEISQAAVRGDADGVRELLGQGADGNNDSGDPTGAGSTPLMLCANQPNAKPGHVEVAGVLVDWMKAGGLDGKMDGSFVNFQLANGDTALQRAAFAGNLAVAQLLLERGGASGINFQHFANGGSALLWAAFKGHTEMVRLLLGNGADTTLQSKDGKTAQDFAQSQGLTEMIELLATAEINQIVNQNNAAADVNTDEQDAAPPAPTPNAASKLRKATEITNCGACVEAGFGWSPQKGKCGKGYANKSCPEHEDL